MYGTSFFYSIILLILEKPLLSITNVISINKTYNCIKTNNHD